tara:strand:+ start:113415 stop:114029 length:615 start_codon:yes stop_codon:yes gene_type:complete
MQNTPETIVIYDAEYWSDEGCMARGWNGLKDHPPYLIQFSAIKVKLEKGLPEVDRCNIFLQPVDVFGNNIDLTKYFTDLTHITQDILDENAQEIPEALSEIKNFVGEDLCYSYGGDEREISLSCFLWQQDTPLNPQLCRDVRKMLHTAGMSEEDLKANTSGSLANFFGLPFDGHIHDATADSLSILLTFRHFVETEKMSLSDFI